MLDIIYVILTLIPFLPLAVYLIDAKTIKPMQSFIANSGRTAENCCCSQSQADLNNGGEDDGQNEANKDFEKYSRNRQ